MEKCINYDNIEKKVLRFIKLIALPIAAVLGLIIYIPALMVKLMSNGIEPSDRDSMIISALLTLILFFIFLILMI